MKELRREDLEYLVNMSEIYNQLTKQQHLVSWTETNIYLRYKKAIEDRIKNKYNGSIMLMFVGGYFGTIEMAREYKKGYEIYK